ncbi:hypothetical protein [Aerococcus viridans]|uniref:hypothetical protein n=1 Tax=Aerococcus viridans TaxID=1377 RepID=UPI002155DA41|nr:hypothetical protein [Aerococcus viridans]
METIKDVFEQQIDKVSALYIDYQNNPFSVKLVHDLRVAISRVTRPLKFYQKTVG